MATREDVLARIRTAVGSSEPPPVPRDYQRAGTLTRAQVLDLAVERIADYRATVVRVVTGGLPGEVETALAGTSSVVCPDGLPDAVLAAIGDRAVTDDDVLGPHRLDRIDAVVTTAQVAIALTGTIVLDGGPGQGRRALTLVPDLHVVVLLAEQVVETVPEALGRLDPTRPLTFVSGPSATSDIELDRVEGVHGPRTLVVLLVEPDETQASFSGSPATS